MKVSAAILMFSSVALSKPLHTDLGSYSYESFLTEFDNKPWSASTGTEEYETRKALFQERVEMMIAHNNEGHSWHMNVNKFADMLDTEIAQFRGYNPAMHKKGMLGAASHTLSGKGAPSSVDYRTSPYLTPIKDQGGCGSCWAFSATESMEFYWNKAQAKKSNVTSTQTILAPQQITSCTPNPNHCGGTGGCDGAIAELAFEYAIGAGVALNSDYPYHGQTGVCKTNVNKVAHFSAYTKLPENNITALVDVLANVGVVSVSVDAGAWSFYGGGIYTPNTYSSVDLDHAVQAVGYGSENGKDYWIVRNSWGSGWGEQGYIRLAKNDGSQQYCGLDKTPADGSGCTGGPTQITACGNSGILYDTCYITV